MTQIDTDWLKSSATQSVLSLITDAGHQALIVGGAVRNALMNLPVTDIDIATFRKAMEPIYTSHGKNFSDYIRRIQALE